MMSEMKEDVRVMVVREESDAALREKPGQPQVACLTFRLGCLALFLPDDGEND